MQARENVFYGDYFTRTHDPEWDVNTPLWSWVLFGIGVVAGHCLAAFQGPELHRLQGGWSSVGIWVLIVVIMLMHYESTLCLARYTKKVVVPTVVVHPYMLLLCFFSRHTAPLLRASLSIFFLVAFCLVNYKKAKLEEELTVESFGQSYLDNADKSKMNE
ncbi:hypothetical protein Bca52824_022513 [Brassica carinata]|uniref:Uncharacterized protein n=1 Tax=Brassica carinata TaxID=52824 RepID=A0A8X7VGT0_BRACI|nr:hypothetical protein Bca52824_022513 [Brassica carinata]